MQYQLNLKTNARAALQGYWLRAMVAFALTFSASAFVTMASELAIVASGASITQYSLVSGIINLVAAVFSLFIVAPVDQGFTRWLWERSGGGEPSVAEVLYVYGDARRYIRFIALRLGVSVVTFGSAALLAAPACVYFAMQSLGKLPESILISLVGSTGSAALICAGVVIAIILTLRYFMVPYLFIIDSNAGVAATMRRSAELTNGRKAEIFVFMLRFIPWRLLCVLGLPALYASPYINMSMAMMARGILDADKAQRVFAASSDAGIDPSATAVFDPAAGSNQT